MRKRIISTVQPNPVPSDPDWLNIEQLAEVEITSEDAAHPIESALLPGNTQGWRASTPGEQTIRLLFAQRNRELRETREHWEAKAAKAAGG